MKQRAALRLNVVLVTAVIAMGGSVDPGVASEVVAVFEERLEAHR